MTDLSAISELIEEVHNCPYCYSSRKETILTRNRLRIVTCSECGLKYTDRRWNKKGILLYYQEGYYTGKISGAYKNYLAEKSEKLLDFNYKFKFLKQFCNGSRLLDVGCATGFSLSAAKTVGFIPEGIELSEWAVQHNTTELKIFRKNLIELDGQTKYDVISMWDVIEHLLEPDKAFLKLYELLLSGGILIFTYPDPTSWLARMLGRRWGNFIPEEHYFFYPPKILEDWLRRYGFQKIYECLEKRYFSLGKLSQKSFPSFEPYLNSMNINRIMLSFPIPYKRMVVFQKR